MKRRGELPVAYLSYDDLRRVADDALAKLHPEGSIPVPIEEILDLRYEIDRSVGDWRRMR